MTLLKEASQFLINRWPNNKIIRIRWITDDHADLVICSLIHIDLIDLATDRLNTIAWKRNSERILHVVENDDDHNYHNWQSLWSNDYDD